MRLRERIKESPVLSGGLTVYVIALAVIALFVIGVVGGNLWNRAADSATPSNAAESNAVTATAPESAAPDPGGIAPQGDANGAPAAGGTGGSPAPDVAADLAAATNEPSDAGLAPAYQADWLARNFGEAVAPVSLAGLDRSSLAVAETNVTAVYSGGESGTIESARLVVSRLAEGEKAASKKEEGLGEFTHGQLDYTRGGRAVTQGVTNESRLDLFPPALRFVWASGDHIVQFTIIPIEPGRASAARMAGLEFIDGLKY